MFDVATLKDLNILLRWNRLHANGKNVCLDHLYATAADSIYAAENLLGIYLTNPEHAWMAVWMAVTNRAVIKKRQLEYYAPDSQRGDFIGNLGIHLPGHQSFDRVFVNEAYLHLFEVSNHWNELRIDQHANGKKLDALKGFGFTRREVELRGRKRNALVTDEPDSAIVYVDAWQVAIINVPRLIPKDTARLLPSVITELRERAAIIPLPPHEEYIRPSLPSAQP